ncbi:MAG: acetyl-coenzyme A synthetase, partial [Rhodobacteraceae bacterium]|nr:acetyl-coenzyme A synthetase [Paracoccaceae bacterium]
MADTIYPPAAAFAASSHADKATYEAMYAASIADPDAFWDVQGKRLDWMTPYTRVKNTTFEHAGVSIKWYEDGVLNVSANCIDRHLATRGNQTAIIWEGDNPEDSAHITYAQLHTEVCKLANVYKSLGVRKGDRVVLYMPMIPEAAYAMLACNRIGAVHSIVFGGFSPEALAARITACEAKLIVTADQAPRGGKATPLKANVDKALEIAGDVPTLV